MVTLSYIIGIIARLRYFVAIVNPLLIFKMTKKPQIFLGQMNLCVALSKNALKFFILVRTIIFSEFSKWRKVERHDQAIGFTERVWVECNL